MRLEDILNNKWDVLSYNRGTSETKYYMERVREAPGVPLFAIHTHRLVEGITEQPSIDDVLSHFGANQYVEWMGITTPIGGTRPEDFAAGKENLLVFHSDIEDIAPLKEGWDADQVRRDPVRFKNEVYDSYSFEFNFENSHKAKLFAYGELMERLG